MNIFESITAIMLDIEPISKDRTNTQGAGFKYRGIDDVMNSLQPILAKHKVFIIPEVVEQIREERVSKNGGNLIYSILKIKHRFTAEDGTCIESTTIGEAMDSGDKASNKAMAIAYKYACFQVFCIPTEDEKDPDGKSHEAKSKEKPINKPNNDAGTKEKPSEVITDAQRTRLFAICKDQVRVKEVVLKYGYESSKDIKKSDYEKICKELEQ